MNPRKTWRRILAGSRDVRFDDLLRVAEAFGFVLRRVSGSHHILLYRPYEVVTDAGSQGKLVRERSRPGSARRAFHAAQAASTTAS